MSASERLCRNHHAAEKHTRTPDSSDTYGVVSTRTAPSSRSGSTSFGEAMNKPLGMGFSVFVISLVA